MVREQAGIGGPEGGNWRALPDENKDDGSCEGYNEDAAVHENAPKLKDREDAILKKKATNHALLDAARLTQDERRASHGVFDVRHSESIHEFKSIVVLEIRQSFH